MRFNSHNTREKNIKTIFLALKSIAGRFVSASKVLIPIFAVVALTGGYLVYAYTIDTTEYVLQTLKVIPTSISSETWANVEQAGIQDLNSDALIQSFNSGNSATINFEDYYPKPEPEVLETPVFNTQNTQPQPQPQPQPQQDLDGQVLGESLDDIDEQIQVEPELEVLDELPEEVVEPATPEPVIEAVDTSVNEVAAFKKATKSFFTALSTVVEMFPFTNGSTTVITEPAEEVVVPVEVVADIPEEVVEDPEPESESVTIEFEQNIEVPEVATSSEQVEVTPFEDAPSSTDEVVSVETNQTANVASTSETLISEETVVDFTLPPCLLEDGCQSHELLFEGFDIPDIEGGSRIENIQVRLSLGSDALSSVNTIQRLRVQYTFGETWSDAEVIDLTSEVANSVNGDYYLLALPT